MLGVFFIRRSSFRIGTGHFVLGLPVTTVVVFRGHLLFSLSPSRAALLLIEG